MKKILSFGESLIRYDFDHKGKINIFPTGTSLNFLSNISELGNSEPIIISGFSDKKDSKIFNDFLNIRKIENKSFINEYPIGSYQIHRTENIFGWEVVYNRNITSWSKNKLKFKKENLDSIDLFHFDGISLYSSKNSLKYTLEALENAQLKKITIAFDFNLRKSMIKNISETNKIFNNVFKKINILNISFYDLLDFFKVKNIDDLLKNKNFLEVNKNTLIIGTKKTTIENKLNIYSFKISKGKFEKTKDYNYEPKELIGQGDAFAAHSIDQYINTKKIDINESLEWSIYKTNYLGDSSVQTKKEYIAFKNGKNVYR